MLSIDTLEDFRKWHTLTLESILECREFRRVDFWIKAYAIGDREWVKDKLRVAGIRRMNVETVGSISYAVGRKV